MTFPHAVMVFDITFRAVLVLLLYLRCSHCFLPTRGSAVLETDFTMEDIIRTGIRHAIVGDTDTRISYDYGKMLHYISTRAV